VLAAMPADVRLEILPGRETISLISDDFSTNPSTSPVTSRELLDRALAAAAPWSPRLVAGASAAVRLLVDEDDARNVVAELHRTLFE
jgi:hypothetical protein